MKKSKFNLSYLNSTTGNAGYLIPFLLQPTLPNDTFRLSLSSFIRAQPMLAPLMHEVKFYTQYWFVPNRIIWDEWEEFITGGSELTSAPVFPVLPAGTTFKVGELGDYFGFPTGVDVGGISVLPFRAYTEIWNMRYRDEDLQTMLPISYSSGADSTTSLQLQSPSWKRDYFTTARPFTQRGSSISVPITQGSGDITQFKFKGYSLSSVTITSPGSERVSGWKRLKFGNGVVSFSLSSENLEKLKNNVDATITITQNVSSSSAIYIYPDNCSISPTSYPLLTDDGNDQDGVATFVFSLLPLQETAFVSNFNSECIECEINNTQLTANPQNVILQVGQVETPVLGSISIRDLRASSALQRYAERSLEWGNRYEEFIQREFGIKPRDSRIQRPEYLGGGSGTLQISEVLQTAEGADTGVGTMRGHGVAGLSQRPIKFRAPEHGFIIGLISIRPKPVYTQGVPREFLKKSRLDFFTPELANIGMQEVLERELYFTAGNENAIFGYSERYQEYRYNQPKVTGEFRSTLSYWNMARQFDKAPVLNGSFINMSNSSKAFYRPFASQTTHQFLMMLRNNIKAYRPVPKRARNILK